MTVYNALAKVNGAVVEIPPTDQLAIDAGAMTITPTGAQAGTGKLLADQLDLLPYHFGVVADAYVAANGLLQSGTDQTAKLNAYFSWCRDNRREPTLPEGPNGAGYLVLGTLTLFQQGRYDGEIIAPNYATDNAVVVVPPNPADVLVGSVDDVKGWSNLFRGSGQIGGLGFLKARFTATISVGNPAVVTRTSHGLALNDPIQITTTGTLPKPLMAGVTYFVVPLTNDTFGLAATPYGGGIRTTEAGSGTHTVTAKYSLKGCYVTVSTADEALIGRAGGGGDRTIKQGQGFYVSNDDGRTPHPLYSDWHPNGGADNTSFTATIAAKTQAILNRRGHGLAANTAITLTTTGTLPAPLAPNTTYYVLNALPSGPSVANFAIATSAGGSPISITTPGSGVHSYVRAGDEPRTVAITAPALVTRTNHGIAEGTPVRLTTTGTLPAPFTTAETYFAILVTTNGFSLTAGGAFGPGIAATSAGSGTHTFTFSPSYAWPWTDANSEIRAQRVQEPISIGGLRVTYYKPSAGSGLPTGERNKVISVTRCNTTLHHEYVRNLSGTPVAQGLHVSGCCFVSIYDSSVAGLLTLNTNYSVALGGTCDIDIYSTNITECRRSLDQHRCINTTVWGGCWSDAVGAHWQSGTKIIGATIGTSNSAIYMSGGDVTVLGCRIICLQANAESALFNLRDDIWTFPGSLHIGGGTVVVFDVSNAPSGAVPPILLDLEGPRDTYDTFRAVDMPANITIDRSVIVKVVGSNASTILRLLRYTKNFDAGLDQLINGSSNIYIGCTIEFDSTNTEISRCSLLYTNDDQIAGGDCNITIENVPSLDALVVPGSNVAKKTGRANLTVRNVPGPIRLDLRGGAIHNAEIVSTTVTNIDRRSTYLGDETVRIIDPASGYRTNGTLPFSVNSSGITVPVQHDKDQVLIVGTGTVASLTLRLPPTDVEGRTAAFITQVAVSSVSYNYNGQTAGVGSPPTSLVAGQRVLFQFLNAGSGFVWQYIR